MTDTSKFCIWALVITWIFMIGILYVVLDINHRLTKHVEETPVTVEHPSLEEMLGSKHQVYITIKTENMHDTCTVQKSK